MWKLVMLATLISAAALPTSASTVSITPSMSQTDIQNALNSAAPGDTISFASGTYNLSVGTSSTMWASLVLPPGLTYVGPAAPSAPAVLHSSGCYALGVFYGTGLTIQNLVFDGGGLYLGGAVSNVNIQKNVFQNINAPCTDENTEIAIFIDTSAANSDISYNTFQNIGGSLLTEFVDEVFSSGILAKGLSNTTITHNNFNTFEEGIHVFYDNLDGENVHINYNTFTQGHRISIEQQDQLAGGLEVAYNIVSSPLNAWALTYGLSIAASSQTSTGISVHDNVVDANTPVASACTGSGCYYPYGIEAWGTGTQVFNNTIEGLWGHGVSIGSAQNLSVTNNSICGPTMSANNTFVDYEYGSQPGTVISGNTTSANMTCGQTGSGSALAVGIYSIVDAASPVFAFDGGFYQAYWGYLKPLEEYQQSAGNTYQQWVFSQQSSGVFQICNVGVAANGTSGSCLSENSGAVSFGYSPDNWIVTPSGSGYTIKNSRTGNYMGPDPGTQRGLIQTSSTASVWHIVAPQ